MSNRRRLAHIERRLGIRHGSRQVCPTCDGSGWDDTEARMAVLIPQRMNAVIEQFTGHPGDFPEPDPATLPPAIPCTLCHATGITSVATVQGLRAQSAGNRERVARMFEAATAHLR